jgi:hypothetical protein
MRKTLALVAALVMAGACQVGATPASPASVAVQSSDARGLVRCDVSGDINHVLNQEKASNPSAYASTKREWDAAKSAGATAAYLTLYADQKARCAVISNTSSADISGLKLIVSYVVQFKDQATAVKAYGGSLFGLNPSQLSNNQLFPATVGAKTGLGANSIVVTEAAGTTTNYIAEWQNKAFVVVLFVINLDAKAGLAIAKAENSRIT